MNATVWRAAERDRNGDPVDADGNVIRVGADGTMVGTITGLIVGAQSVTDARARGSVTSTEGMLGVPVDGLALKHDDTVVTDTGIRWRVAGPPQWGKRHSLTGSTATARYVWWKATALYN